MQWDVTLAIVFLAVSVCNALYYAYADIVDVARTAMFASALGVVAYGMHIRWKIWAWQRI